MNTLTVHADRAQMNDRTSRPSVGRIFSLRRGAFFGSRPWGRLPSLVLIAFLAGFLAVSPVTATTGIPELDDALEAQKSGRLKEAVTMYTEVLEKHPQSAEAMNWRGMAYDELGEYDAALADLTKAVNTSPNYADAYNNRGEVYRKLKKYREAMADYRKAASLEPNFAEAHYNIGLLAQYVEKNPAEAVKEYEQYLRLKPKAADKDQLAERIKTLKAAAAAAPTPKPAEAKPPAAQPPAVQPPAAQAPAARPPAAKPPTAQAPEAQRPAVQPPTAQAPAGQPPAATQPPKAPSPAGPPKKFQPGVPPSPAQPAVPSVPGVPGLPGGIPTSPEQLQALLTNVLVPALMASLVFVLIGLLVYIVLTSLPYFLIANKTGTSGGWMAFIPVLDKYLKAKIAGKGAFTFVLFVLGDPVVQVAICLGLLFLGALISPVIIIAAILVPALLYLISTLIWIPICTGIADARGKAAFWGLLICLPMILLTVVQAVVAIVDVKLLMDLNMVFTGLAGLSLLTWFAVPYYLALSR
ncbi:MAG: tetratricopeptide repeat protein [Desulfomonile tiedjei]|nr:tetratricopeptide repeat protein [Desulfomonile tiedjei]